MESVAVQPTELKVEAAAQAAAQAKADPITAIQIEAACMSLGYPYRMRPLARETTRCLLTADRKPPRVRGQWLNGFCYMGTVRI